MLGFELLQIILALYLCPMKILMVLCLMFYSCTCALFSNK